jgi:hypothetical protein
MSETTTNIDINLMLDVIEFLPRVEPTEVDDTREAFSDAINSYDGYVPFVRGYEGDGAIFVDCDWSNVYEDKSVTTLGLGDDGWLINSDINFEERIPFRVARYFIATVFDLEELTPLAQKHFYIEKDKASGLEDDGEEDYVPEPTPKYVPDLLKGARLLYECADLAGDISYCLESEGMKIIERVKKEIEGVK